MFLNPLQSCPKIGWQVYYIAETEDKYDGVFTIHQSLVYNTLINVSLQTQYSCTDSQQSGFPQFLPSWAAAHNTSRALALSPSRGHLHRLFFHLQAHITCLGPTSRAGLTVETLLLATICSTGACFSVASASQLKIRRRFNLKLLSILSKWSSLTWTKCGGQSPDCEIFSCRGKLA